MAFGAPNGRPNGLPPKPVGAPPKLRGGGGDFSRNDPHGRPTLPISHPVRSPSESRNGAESPASKHGNIFRVITRALVLIVAWYAMSTVLNLYNKKIFGQKYGILDHEKFPLPSALTSLQFFIQHLLARLAHCLGAKRTVAPGEGLPWHVWRRTVLPNGIATGLDIGLTNAAMATAALTFVTMCKASAPLFLLLFAFVWRLETPRRGLLLSMALISGGLSMLVAGEADFHLMGFLLVMSASACAGIRWTITQLQLQGSDSAAGLYASQGTALEVLEKLTPVMSVTTAVLSLLMEPVFEALTTSVYFASVHNVVITVGLAAAGAMVAFLMVWTEFALIAATSAVTFAVAGVVKEVLTVVISEAVFQDTFTTLNGVGLAVLLIGVALYKYQKFCSLVEDSSRPDAGYSNSKQRSVPLAEIPSANGERGLPESEKARLLPDGSESVSCLETLS